MDSSLSRNELKKKKKEKGSQNLSRKKVGIMQGVPHEIA